MKVYDFLRTDSPYKTDDIVEGTVYGKNPEYGVSKSALQAVS